MKTDCGDAHQAFFTAGAPGEIARDPTENLLARAAQPNWNLTKRPGLRIVTPESGLHRMRSRQTTFSPLLRSVAAGALLVWVAAQVLCFAHCQFGVGHGGSEPPSCHAPAPTPSPHDNGDSSAGITCSTLKSALPGSGSAVLVQPEFPQLYTLAPFALSLDVTATEPTACFFRQAKTLDWVFTPEVSLGPAHRSHAPPFLT